MGTFNKKDNIADALTGRLLNKDGSNKGYAKKGDAPMLDLAYGGQFGFVPNYKEWINNQAYVRKNLIAILLQAPKMFQFLGNGYDIKDATDDLGNVDTIWTPTLKSLIELHARSFEGLNAGLTVETAEHPFGGAGEMMEEVTNVTRARSQVTFTFIEKYGEPIRNFFENWIQYGAMDPEAKVALIASVVKNIPDLLADWFTMTVLFFEPDPTFTKVQKAWIGYDMMPKGTGEVTGKRDLTEASDITTMTVEFTGVYQFGLGPKVMAKRLLDEMNILQANPYFRAAGLNGVTTEVNDLLTTEGIDPSFKKSIDDIKNESKTLVGIDALEG